MNKFKEDKIMSDVKRTVEKVEENTRNKEVKLEDLEKVSGGSITNVTYTATKPISKDTQNKI